MNENKRKVEITQPSEVDQKEIEKAQDFSRLITKFDEAKKPLSQRRLFEYKQRWFFLGIVIIALIIMLLLGYF
jgi:hypothetical protein